MQDFSHLETGICLQCGPVLTLYSSSWSESFTFKLSVWLSTSPCHPWLWLTHAPQRNRLSISKCHHPPLQSLTPNYMSSTDSWDSWDSSFTWESVSSEDSDILSNAASRNPLYPNFLQNPASMNSLVPNFLQNLAAMAPLDLNLPQNLTNHYLPPVLGGAMAFTEWCNRNNSQVNWTVLSLILRSGCICVTYKLTENLADGRWKASGECYSHCWWGRVR